MPADKYLLAPCFLTLDGGPSSGTVFLSADLASLPPPDGASDARSGGGIIVGDDIIWLNPYSATIFIVPLATNAAGHAEFAVSLSLLPVGFELITQWLVPDAGAYLRYDFSDALFFQVGLR